MVDGLILENFKAFGARQYIPLAPITLIFGANSAGKSSIIQSLLLLCQSIDNIDSPEQVFLFKGDFSDLGSYRDSVFNHDVSRSLEISVMASGLPNRLSRLRHSVPFDLSRRGIGVRYTGPDNASANVSFPVYLGNHDHPAYSLHRKKPIDEEQISHLRPYQLYSIRHSNANAGKLFEVEPQIAHEHPFWNAWFDVYRDSVLPAAEQLVERLISYLKDSRESENHTSIERISAVEIRMFMSDFLTRSTLGDRPYTREEARSNQHAISFLSEQQDRIHAYDYEDFLQAVFDQGSSELTATVRNFTVERLMLRRDDPLDRMMDYRGPYNLPRLLGLSNWRHLPPLPEVDVITESMASIQRRFVSGMKYLGPLRGYPERHYVVGGRSSTSVGRLGESSAEVLFGNPAIAERVDDYIQRFGFGYELRLAELVDRDQPDSQGGVFGVRLIDKVTGVNVSLVDVGFGISQVLPVIVQSLLTQESTIAIEQPEIHLHPALQAELAELFADSISEPNNNRFIIETHSEHLILRFQRLIRKGKLRPEDISVLYVSRPTHPSSLGATIQRLRLDKAGEFLDEWPGGFFEEGFREMFDL